MKIVIAADSFKGSLSSIEAGNAIKKGIYRVFSDAIVNVKPLADGGEGSVNTLVEGHSGRYVKTIAKGPLMEDLEVTYGIINDTTAIIEMANISGITLVKKEDRNPMNTTTYGVGQVIIDAINNGCNNFIICIGGSSTNDGGVGMLQALGYSFKDKNKQEIEFGAKGLKNLYSINNTNINKKLNNCTFKIACDVNNPLCGLNGASCVYGPQKGASKEMVSILDEYLNSYADLVYKTFKKGDKNLPSSGAAGGLGFAFSALLNASLVSGSDLIIQETKLEKFIKEADYVITGEGMLDEQTIMGKGPFGVVKLAKKHNKKIIAFSGGINNISVLNDNGIDACFCILNNITSLEEAMKKENALSNLINTVEQVFKIIKLGK